MGRRVVGNDEVDGQAGKAVDAAVNVKAPDGLELAVAVMVPLMMRTTGEIDSALEPLAPGPLDEAG